MKSRMLKFIPFLLSVFLVAYITYHLVSAVVFEKKLKTEYALIHTIEETIQVKGVFIRNETILQEDYDGFLDYLLENGEKVSMDETVAYVYPSDNIAVINAQIKELESKISGLDNIINPRDLWLYDTTKLEEYINEEIINLAKITSSGDLNKINPIKNNLERLINTKKIVLGEAENFNLKLDEYRKDLEELKLEVSIGTKTKSISSPISGYFVSIVDGYEGLTLGDMTVEKIEALSKLNLNLQGQLQSSTGDTIGKVISDFKWYYACVVRERDIYDVKLNSYIKIRFDNDRAEDISVKIMDIKKENDDLCVVILEGDTFTDYICMSRNPNAELILGSYTGLKVSKDALRRTVDGIDGVFTILGMSYKFKEIENLYEKDNYVIVNINPENPNIKSPLLLYDEILIGGVDIEDGKFVK